jgi:hypothetical protein
MFLCPKCAPKFNVSDFKSATGLRSYEKCESCGEFHFCIDTQLEDDKKQDNLL